LLRRAVQSVINQDYDDLEIIVSDNDTDAQENQVYIQGLKAPFPIRYLTCPRQGQVPNLNNGVSYARGHWVKPLYDDDTLQPGSLTRFALALKVLSTTPDVCPVLVACQANRLHFGKLVSRGAARASCLRVIKQQDVHYSMFVQDVDIGTPSQVLVRRDVARSTPMKGDGLVSAVDSMWFARLLQNGDLVMLNEALVDLNQGGHETITSTITEKRLDEEMLQLRSALWTMMDKDCTLNEEIAAQALWFMRGISRIKRKRFIEALRLLARVRHPRGWLHGARWLLRRLFPGRFQVVPRQTVPLPRKGAARHTPSSQNDSDRSSPATNESGSRRSDQSCRPEVFQKGDDSPYLLGDR